MTAYFADRLQRLRRMDAALATEAGLNVPAFAAEEGVHRKTIDRDLTVLQQCGLQITTTRDPALATGVRGGSHSPGLRPVGCPGLLDTNGRPGFLRALAT